MGVLLYSLWAYWRFTNFHQGSASGQGGAAPVTAPQRYYCPMHPHVTSEKAGENCHICGMKLIVSSQHQPRHDTGPSAQTPAAQTHDSQTQDLPAAATSGVETAAAGEPAPERAAVDEKHVDQRGTIFLSAESRRQVGLAEAEVVARPLFKSIRAPGRVAFDPELYNVRSDYIEALRQWEKVRNSPLDEVRRSAEEMLRSARTRLKIMGLSEKQIREIGPQSSTNETLLHGEKGKEVWVYAEVFEVDLDLVKVGHAVEVTAPFLPGSKLSGKVVGVDNLINPESRTARVRVQILRPGVDLRPESFVTVHILCPMGQHLSVPREAILDSGRESFVFRAEGDGHYLPVPVQLLFWADRYAAIAGAIKAGDRVVRKGNFMLDSESRLSGILQTFAE